MAYKKFDQVPNHYAGPIIQHIKDFRLKHGRRSIAPTSLQVGQMQLLIPRHFGFCFGVERYIHGILYTREASLDKRTYLVSEIIHNPLVNKELKERGVDFVYDTQGRRLVAESELSNDDIVLILLLALLCKLKIRFELRDRHRRGFLQGRL